MEKEYVAIIKQTKMIGDGFVNVTDGDGNKVFSYSNFLNDHIDSRLSYTSIDDGQKLEIEAIKHHLSESLKAIDALCPDSRSKSIAITKIEEAAMWASKAISHKE